MGIWRGSAPLSPGGDWSHGVHLKFNAHRAGSFEERPDAAGKIGHAVGLAIAMAERGLAAVKEIGRARAEDHARHPGWNPLVECFGSDAWKRANLDAIVETLGATARGLREAVRADQTLEERRASEIQLFDRNSKPADPKRPGNEHGYVRDYPVDDKTKAKRPTIAATPDILQSLREEGDLARKVKRRVGHIHISLDNARADTVERLARTILHEATHRYAGTGDFAYADHAGEFHGATTAERINNAGSYAEFCFRLRPAGA
jgi:hypothetical protein